MPRNKLQVLTASVLKRTAVVLALNPSIDAEWRVNDVQWEEKNMVESERRWAGGKGINVARWLRFFGGHSRLILPLGGETGMEVAGHLRKEGIPRFIVCLHPLRQPTRVNLIITTSGGSQLRFNPSGPKLSRSNWRSLLKATEWNLGRLGQSVLLVLSGSLPRGVPATAYAELIRLGHRAGVRTLLDCDGAALAAAVKANPFLVKPNEAELAQWWGKPLRSEAAVVQAARALSRITNGWVLVSRGAKRGLLLNHTSDKLLWAQPPRVSPRNTVGAGDALLAAVARQIQLDAPPKKWLRSGLAAGSTATQHPPGALPA